MVKREGIIKILVLLLFLGCKESPNVQGEKVLYEVVFRGKPAGVYEKLQTGGNSYHYRYHYTDRGRGPDLTEEVILSNKGYIKEQSISGVNYRKAPVNESFMAKGTSATWINPMGQSSGDFDGEKLYFRFNGSPAVYETLVQLLLTSKNRKVELYPKGQAELVQKFPFTLSNGISVDLIMVKGLDMNPTYLWVMGDSMVASISGNLHVVRDDLKPLRLELKKIQDNVEDNYLIGVTKELTHKIEKAVIKNVNVLTPTGNVLEKQDVLIDDGIIKTLSPANSETFDEDAREIDGSNKTLMPGMFDMHTHNGKFRGILHIAGGVTSVRDLANNKQLKHLAHQFNTNEIIGPRIVTFCGIIDGSGPFANQRNVVDNLEEGLAEVQIYKDLGYEQIKLYSSIKPEWVKPLVAKSHALGMRVSGHIPAYMTASQAIEQGYDEIQHINMVFLNFLSDTIDTRTPLRHTMPAMHGADLDLNSAEYTRFVELLKSKDILIDPTVAIFENMYISKKGEPSPTYKAIIDRLPLMNQRDYYNGGLPKPGDTAIRYRKSLDKMLAVIHDLYRKGVPIVPGTDGLPGFLYHRELELYVKAGLKTTEMLKLATIESAKITGVSDSLGSVEIGKKADLILVDGNPVEHISDIRKIEWTMKDGNLFYAKELYGSMGIQHFK